MAAFFPLSPAVRVQVLAEADHNGFASHPRELAAITLDLLAAGR